MSIKYYSNFQRNLVLMERDNLDEPWRHYSKTEWSAPKVTPYKHYILPMSGIMGNSQKNDKQTDKNVSRHTSYQWLP